ncbi:Fasciclin-domain-containing protein [Periconia macrospinosa]|uniref:Fasciclin-domain-containing protein n=1 Tax=Periconia macrospinosa TaxID=97972 RepID=A0A2V1DM36_9PLEO|nr:Fasciclin-domain-containing protein [Periconia macrospinosa]
MLWKHLPIAALVGYAFAQEGSQSLNATLSGNQELSSLRTFLSSDPTLLQTLSQARNVTILAPSNEAFERAAELPAFAALATDPESLASVLLYHILNGTIRAGDITNTSTFVPTYLTNNFTASNVTEGQVVEAVRQGNETSFYSGLLSRANVTEANLNFTGGVIHIIDSVLRPPVDLLETANAFNLTAFRGALNATGLANSLVSVPDVTIFAPNNEAFTNINSAIGGLSNETLQNILAYHVVNGTVAYSTLLEDGQNVTASDGQNLTITLRNGSVFVNQARVVTANVLVGNGVVHVIDSVLNPQNATTPEENATSGVNAYPSATRSGDNVPFTSGQPTPTTTANPTTAAPTGQRSVIGGTGGTQGSPAAASRPMATGVGYSVALGVAAAWFL